MIAVDAVSGGSETGRDRAVRTFWWAAKRQQSRCGKDRFAPPAWQVAAIRGVDLTAVAPPLDAVVRPPGPLTDVSCLVKIVMECPVRPDGAGVVNAICCGLGTMTPSMRKGVVARS